ncbi:universal stress protein [Thermoleophilia bacterium SCSIO 60948]|nr:universal stress protein [Thermoleophilia bacterium SCSIO 60948]
MQEVIAAFEDTPQGRDALALGDMLADVAGAELSVASIYELDPLLLRVGEYPAVRNEYFDRAFAAAHEATTRPFTELPVTAISPQEGLQRVAIERKASVVVVGSSHRSRVGRLLAGNVGEGVLSAAPCAVAVAPRDFARAEHPAKARIGVAWDGRPEARAALESAIELAAAREGTQLTIMTIAPTYTDFEGETHVFDELREKYEAVVAAVPGIVPEHVAYTTELIELRARSFADQIAERGADLDLLIVGSRSFGPVRRALVGSTSRQLFRSAPCPVMIVPRTGAEEDEVHADSSERRPTESVPAA